MKKLFSALIIFSYLLSGLCFASAVTVSDFRDISSADWFYDAVSFVISRGMFNGTSADDFSPNLAMTRGMFVTVLGRYGGAPKELVESDVRPDKYYTPYVRWACRNGIANITDGEFRPEDPITREDICYMLCKFAALKHLKLKPSSPVSSFTDSTSISSICKTPVTVLQQTGVINGYTDGSFRPQNGATRAEVAAMLMRFIDSISYKPVTENSFDQSGNYVFGTVVPESTPASTDYFNDACFIGHSIVVGMHAYFGLGISDFYAVNGASCPYFLNTYSGFELSTTRTDENGNTVQDTGTLSQALSEHSYGKVYIMLGTNEIAAGDRYLQAFSKNLASIVKLVRSSQPNATIYIFAVTPVTQSCSESRGGLNRDNIIDYNAAIKRVCAERRCYYLNVFDLLANGDGFLPEDAALSDGIHILAPQYAKIKSYIFTHTVQ